MSTLSLSITVGTNGRKLPNTNIQVRGDRDRLSGVRSVSVVVSGGFVYLVLSPTEPDRGKFLQVKTEGSSFYFHTARDLPGADAGSVLEVDAEVLTPTLVRFPLSVFRARGDRLPGSSYRAPVGVV